jgi:hypothetical protein
MKTDRLQIRMDYIEERDKPYRNETEGKINYTEDYVKWLEDKIINNINYTHSCKSDSELLNHDLKVGDDVYIVSKKLVEILNIHRDGKIVQVKDGLETYLVGGDELEKVV